MNTSEKIKLTASVRQIERVSKLEIPIYNSEVPDTPGRKQNCMWRTQAIAKQLCISRKRNNPMGTKHLLYVEVNESKGYKFLVSIVLIIKN